MTDQSTGAFWYQQLYAGGHFYETCDIVRTEVVAGVGSVSRVYISHVATRLYLVLKSAGAFYQSVGYQGSVIGCVRLNNTNRVEFMPISNSLMSFSRASLLGKYQWDMETDTATLYDKHSFQQYFIEQLREICWDLGYQYETDESITSFLKEFGFYVAV